MIVRTVLVSNITPTVWIAVTRNSAERPLSIQKKRQNNAAGWVFNRALGCQHEQSDDEGDSKRDHDKQEDANFVHRVPYAVQSSVMVEDWFIAIQVAYNGYKTLYTDCCVRLRQYPGLYRSTHRSIA